MTALAASRQSKTYSAKYIELPGTAQTVYKGGVACWDTSTGLVAKAATSATMVPIGVFTEDATVAAGGTVVIELFRELHARWMANDGTDTVVAANLGTLCYLKDDQTVTKTDATNTQSVAGRIWKIDSVKGVLVEFLQTGSSHISGLDI